MDGTNRLLRFSSFLQPSQCAFLMIPILFTALMAAFLSTTERDSGGWGIFMDFPPLWPSFQAIMPIRRLLKFSQGRFLTSLLANVLLAGGCIVSQPVIKFRCQEPGRQLTGLGSRAALQAAVFSVPSLTDLVSSPC